MKRGGPADLDPQLQSLAREMGATYFGIADLIPAQQYVVEQGGQFLSKFPRAVSHGFALADGIVDALADHGNVAALKTYWYYVYEIVNPRIDSISLILAQSLERAGFRAFFVPASQMVDRTELRAVFSHKLAAHLAGLGWIGKSALLITPHHGPRVRWGTVLTDAPLKAGAAIDQACQDCDVCVKACPAHAFTGQLFDNPRPRGEIFAAEACFDYLNKREKTEHKSCGLCVYECPFGRSRQ